MLPMYACPSKRPEVKYGSSPSAAASWTPDCSDTSVRAVLEGQTGANRCKHEHDQKRPPQAPPACAHTHREARRELKREDEEQEEPRNAPAIFFGAVAAEETAIHHRRPPSTRRRDEAARQELFPGTKDAKNLSMVADS